MSLSDSSSLLDLGILNSLGLIVSVCVTVYLFLLTLFNFASCHLFVLVVFTFFILFGLASVYGFTSFSPILTDSPLIILDEYGTTLAYIIVFVLFYSILTYSFNHFDSVRNTQFLIWLIILISLSSLAVFTSSSLLVIYIGYEISLLPIILIIFLWGAYPERSLAAITMLFYTLFFSLPLMLLLSYLFSSSLSLTPFLSSSLNLEPSFPILFSLLVFSAFAVKLPIYGLHSWLPMAHVEAPTFGSIILAGLLLKLGGCGLYRFLTFFPQLFIELSSYLLAFLVLAITFSSFICSLQSDLNRLIAYSSVVHMTAVGVLYLLDSSMAFSSSLFLMVLHGVSSPLIFYIVGEVYALTGTRLLLIIRSINSYLPILYLSMIIGFYLTVPVPPSVSFLGELYLFGSLLNLGAYIILLSVLYLFMAIVFNLIWLTSFLGSGATPPCYSSVASQFVPLSMGVYGLMSLLMVSSMFLYDFE